MNRLLDPVTRFFAAVTSNPISLAGSALTTVTAFLFLLLFSIHIVSEHGASPYLGILTFLILPGLFLLGLALIPLGLWQARKRRLQALAEDDPAVEFAVLDFNRPQVRKTALVFLAATGINALILGVGTYKGVEVMESTQFCGAACHTVMEPEYTTYKRSPHARVKCVECHIGEGADWFVKSKLSGSWQLVSVAFDLYPTPDRGPRPQPAPGPRDLRAVPLAEQVRGRPLQGQHALRRGRGEHRDEDRARGEGRRPPGGAQPGDPLARGPRPRGALPLGREAAGDLRGRGGDEGRREAAVRRTRRELARGGQGHGVAEDGLRRLPQPPHARLPQPRPRARRRPPRPEDRPRAAVRPPRGTEGPPGRLPQPRGGARGHREGDRRRSTRSPTRRWRQGRRTRSRPRARRSATSGAGTSSRR